jgi:hypothetical protein
VWGVAELVFLDMPAWLVWCYVALLVGMPAIAVAQYVKWKWEGGEKG